MDSYFSKRLKQLSLVLDALLADETWAPKRPAGAIAALGHSAGGCSVLSMLGGPTSGSRLAMQRQVALDDQHSASCSGLFAGYEVVDALAKVNDEDFEVMDPRIRAAIVMAPLCSVFEPESLRHITVPLKIHTEQKDAVLNNCINGN